MIFDDDMDLDEDDDLDEFEDDRDMDLDDDLFPEPDPLALDRETAALDQDQSRRIPGVTFAGEPLTEDLCDEYEQEQIHPWSEIKIQPRIKHRAGVKVSRFSILFEDVATSGREVRIKTRRALRKDPGTSEVHKHLYRVLDACARNVERFRTESPCQCLFCGRAISTLTTEGHRLARKYGILRKNRGVRWTYDRWTGTITHTPRFTFRRPPTPVLPDWVRPLPCPPVALDEVLSVRVNLRVLAPALAKNVRLCLRLFGRYVLPSRVCYPDVGGCTNQSCLCAWMPTLEKAVDPNLYGIKFEAQINRLKYAPKVLVSQTEMSVFLSRHETTAEAQYQRLHRSDRGQFSSIQYGEALTPFEFEGKQGQVGDRVALWHYGHGQTTIAARTPRKDAPKVEIVRRTVKGRVKVPHRPGQAPTRPRPRSGPARHAQSHGLGPERNAGVIQGEIMAGGLCPIQFMSPLYILIRVANRGWCRS